MAVVVSDRPSRLQFGLVYAWSGVAIMAIVWLCFAIFLAEPRRFLAFWPIQTVDGDARLPVWAATIVDLLLIAMFGLQHSVMARPWFKQRVMAGMPRAYERCTYVHMANAALLALVVLWQPIPIEVWNVGDGALKDSIWSLFAVGWIILFLGAWSFGIRDLLGVEQMRTWVEGHRTTTPSLKQGFLYRWLRHPMYMGVLLAVWATPRMSAGHILLAIGFTGYVFTAMRYEERDLRRTFGASYTRWRESA